MNIINVEKARQITINHLISNLTNDQKTRLDSLFAVIESQCILGKRKVKITILEFEMDILEHLGYEITHINGDYHISW